MAAPLMGVDATLNTILTCVCERLADSGSPVCTCSTTIGTPAVLCLGDCGCEGGDGELWGNLTRLYRADRQSGLDATPVRPCTPATWYAQYRLTLTRCFPTIDEQGRLPEPADQAAAATAMHADAAEIVTAIGCCTLAEQAWVEGVAVDLDPQGGCSILTVTFRAGVSPRRQDNLRTDG